MARDSVIMRLRRNVLEVEHSRTGEMLATCEIGDDETVERIADILSSKGLREEAGALRRLRDDARRPLGIRGRTGSGTGVGYLKDPRDATND